MWNGKSSNSALDKGLAMAAGLITLMWMVLGSGVALGQDGVDSRCTQPGETACVDWERGLAIAIGTGAPASTARNAAQKNITAMRAARLDAYRNILELVKGVNLDTSSTLKNMMVENDTVNSAISGRLHGLRPVGKTRYFSDGSVTVKIEAQLRQVIPQELYAGEEMGPPRELGEPSSMDSVRQSSLSGTTAYTGLIIDARGTGVVPAMSPKVFDPQGNEVYGSAYVDREFVVSLGMVGYVKGVDKARENDRVKGNPALVKAVESRGGNKADLVVSQADADALRDMSKRQTFLKEARVLIVID